MSILYLKNTWETGYLVLFLLRRQLLSSLPIYIIPVFWTDFLWWERVFREQMEG